MNWKKEPYSNANALTISSYCKNVLVENKDIMSHCSPLLNKGGQVIGIKIIIEYRKGYKGKFSFKSAQDIKESIEELELINHKIQDLCMNTRKSIENS